ncbi:MAG: PEP-CTERM sorting domain-containing protein [Planctomycetes bacterium]|nr:PEP-CTERM sorting domain-containing protein [Planctomycetota bacterium]
MSLWASAPVWAGEVSSTFFTIDVESALGSESWSIASADVNFDPDADTWSWTGQNIGLGDIATLDQAFLTIVGDPQIALGFAVSAGAADTTVTITSAVLSFDPLVNPDGAASAGVTLTEAGDNPPATLVGLAGDLGSAYAAYYNVPPGSVFAEFVTSLMTDTTTSGSGNTGGWVVISDTVSSMQAQYSFILSAGDLASGTSNFLIVPEPASLAMLALGAVALLRRR